MFDVTWADMGDICLALVAFGIVSLSSCMIGDHAVRLKLPLVTGYVLCGVLVGPSVLGLISSEHLPRLAFISDFALATIAFCAGAELYWPDMRSHLRVILVYTALIVAMTLTLVPIGVFLSFGFSHYMDSATTGCLVQLAVLMGSVMIARSPASALAVITEVDAQGPRTMTLLGITVISDVVLLVMYALSVSLVKSQCTVGEVFGASTFYGLGLSLAMVVVFGVALGIALLFYLWIPGIHSPVRGVLIFITGYLSFEFAKEVAEYMSDRTGLDVTIEGLLFCMISGCIAGNESINRRKFGNILHKSSPYIFLPFFTLVGANLDLSAMKSGLGLAVIMALLRNVSIFLGTYIGGKFILGVHKDEYMNLWSTLIPQAGGALGLASEIMKYEGWGPSTSATIVTAAILNQIFGLLIFKTGLRKMGESGTENLRRLKNEAHNGNISVVGMNDVSLTMASRLMVAGAHVRFIQTDKLDRYEAVARLDGVRDHVNHLFRHQLVSEPQPGKLSLGVDRLDLLLIAAVFEELELLEESQFVVTGQDELAERAKHALEPILESLSCRAMLFTLRTDKANYEIIRLLHFLGFGYLNRVIVVLHDSAWAARFDTLGVGVVFPMSALSGHITDLIVNSLEFDGEQLHPVDMGTALELNITARKTFTLGTAPVSLATLKNHELLRSAPSRLTEVPESSTLLLSPSRRRPPPLPSLSNFNSLSKLSKLGMADPTYGTPVSPVPSMVFTLHSTDEDLPASPVAQDEARQPLLSRRNSSQSFFD